jgi:hypothetical protein
MLKSKAKIFAEKVEAERLKLKGKKSKVAI